MKLETKIIALVIFLAFITYGVSPGIGILKENGSVWSWRNEILNLSGVIAFYLMTVTVLLAMRTAWVDQKIGLDRAYRLHKSIGIAATLAAIIHWLIEKVPHWLVMSGIIAHPGDLSSGSYSQLEVILFVSGSLIIEYVFYAVIILVVIGLFQRIPYSFFRKTHKILPALFIIIAYHAVTAQLRDRWLSTPAGYLIIAVAVVAVICSFIALGQKIGKSRRVKGILANVSVHGSLIDITLKLNSAFKYRPGQFAFIRFPHDREPHPFTISGHNSCDNSLRFTIKALGDFTNNLAHNLRIGHEIDVEGPYGALDFNSDMPRQIWIGGGIGITPFMAQINSLTAKIPENHTVDLWYCTKTEEEGLFPTDLEQLCSQAGITLHRMAAEKGETCSASQLKNEFGCLENTAIWFCGPKKFAQDLLAGLTSMDFDVERNFYQEEFDFR